MYRLSLLKPASLSSKQFNAAPVMTTSSIWNTQAMFFSTAKVIKKKETLREREDRRRELSTLMERWQCTVGFEFHV